MKALQYIHDNSLSTKLIQKVKDHPTGYVDIIIGVDGSPSYDIYRPAAFDYPVLTNEQMDEITSFKHDWLYFGTVQQMSIVAW